ncbi:MAG: lytic murein transglycosylase [Candidatus Niyogibacteria bacterium]|nr:lytic murein transglycosylase [Candidatus Niyogibacteria bacterium]
MRYVLRTVAGVLVFIAGAGLSGSFAMAQTVDPALVGERKAALERELAQYEAQIEENRKQIEAKRTEAASFERDVAILNAEIKKAQLAIKARTIAIEQLSDTIGEKSDYVEGLLVKIDREKESLAELMRRVEELDRVSFLEALFARESIAGFFVELDHYDTVQAAVHTSFTEIRKTKEVTEGEIDTLETRKSEEVELRALQQLEKRRIEEKQTEKNKLLALTKGVEAEYQKLLKAREKDAALIRSQLFLLRGSPDIPFEKAVEYANIAFQATNVRPAFLLGVIAEESNLGANVGTGNWNTDMAHSRCASQRKAFEEITAELGLDPNLMPVSKKAWYGYCGGAMGPAQFMPTTWNLYKNLVAKHTGHNPPNPWDPLDAFVASALLLKDNGAAEGTYAAERRAALRYLAGANWQKRSYAFYGDDVMALASKYQDQMNIILVQR